MAGAGAVLSFVVLGQPRFFSHTFGRGASKGAVGTLRRMPESQPSPLFAVL